MTAAYRVLFDPAAPDLPTTHYYIRFEAEDWRELALIQDSFTTFDFNLLREVIHIGQGVPFGEGETPPSRYAVVDAEQGLPDGFHHTLIDALYLPPDSETTLTEQAFKQVDEPFDFQGIPDPGNGDCPHCCRFKDNSCPRNGCSNPAPPSQCNECCEHYPACLYYGDRQTCSKAPDPPTKTNACGCPVPRSFREVAGCVQVEDSDWLGRTAVDVPNIGMRDVAPVIGVDVVAWNGWFRFSSDHTNPQGCFFIPGEFNSRNVHLWTKWKNHNVTVNGWTPGTGSIYRITVDRYLGKSRVEPASGLNRIHIIMTNIGGRDSRSQVWYRASHMLNGVERAIQHSGQIGVPRPPSNLQVVISNAATGSGAAPMLKASNTAILAIAAGCEVAHVVVPPPTSLSACVVFIAANRLIPDVWQNYGNEAPAASGSRTQRVFNHELGHAVHFVGAGRNQWNDNVRFIIGNATTQLLNPSPVTEGAYGNGTRPGSGWCATIESWGEFYGARLMGQEYGPRFFEGTAGDNFQSLERFAPNVVGTPGERWIPEGLPLDLIDFASPTWEGMLFSAVPSTVRVDVVGGLTPAAYYRAMIGAGNNPNPTQIRNQIIANGLPPGQTAAAYTAAFACYGY